MCPVSSSAQFISWRKATSFLLFPFFQSSFSHLISYAVESYYIWSGVWRNYKNFKACDSRTCLQHELRVVVIMTWSTTREPFFLPWKGCCILSLRTSASFKQVNSYRSGSRPLERFQSGSKNVPRTRKQGRHCRTVAGAETCNKDMRWSYNPARTLLG